MDENTPSVDSDLVKACTDNELKVRLAAYEALIRRFQELDPSSAEWDIFKDLMRKLALEDSMSGLTVALRAIVLFVRKCEAAGSSCTVILSALFSEADGGARSLAEAGIAEVLEEYVEIGCGQDVIAHLLKTVAESSSPSVRTLCLQSLKELLSEFGPGPLHVPHVLRSLTHIQETDAGYRGALKAFIVELYSWSGNEPVYGADILLDSGEMEEVISEWKARESSFRPHPARSLRSTSTEAGKDLCTPTQKECSSASVKIDEEFFRELESSDWKRRRDALVELNAALEDGASSFGGNYDALLSALKRIIREDQCVIVVGQAISSVALVAKLPDHSFGPHALGFCKVLLEKSVEKRRHVSQHLRGALEAVSSGATFASLARTLNAYLESKNPSTRYEAIYLASSLLEKSTGQALRKKDFGVVYKSIASSLSHGQSIIRDKSLIALGIAVEKAGEDFIFPYLKDLDKNAMGKIRNYKEVLDSFKKKYNEITTKHKSAAKIDVPKNEENQEQIITKIRSSSSKRNFSKLSGNDNKRISRERGSTWMKHSPSPILSQPFNSLKSSNSDKSLVKNFNKSKVLKTCSGNSMAIPKYNDKLKEKLLDHLSQKEIHYEKLSMSCTNLLTKMKKSISENDKQSLGNLKKLKKEERIGPLSYQKSKEQTKVFLSGSSSPSARYTEQKIREERELKKINADRAKEKEQESIQNSFGKEETTTCKRSKAKDHSTFISVISKQRAEEQHENYGINGKLQPGKKLNKRQLSAPSERLPASPRTGKLLSYILQNKEMRVTKEKESKTSNMEKRMEVKHQPDHHVLKKEQMTCKNTSSKTRKNTNMASTESKKPESKQHRENRINIADKHGEQHVGSKHPEKGQTASVLQAALENGGPKRQTAKSRKQNDGTEFVHSGSNNSGKGEKTQLDPGRDDEVHTTCTNAHLKIKENTSIISDSRNRTAYEHHKGISKGDSDSQSVQRIPEKEKWMQCLMKPSKTKMISNDVSQCSEQMLGKEQHDSALSKADLVDQHHSNTEGCKKEQTTRSETQKYGSLITTESNQNELQVNVANRIHKADEAAEPPSDQKLSLLYKVSQRNIQEFGEGYGDSPMSNSDGAHQHHTNGIFCEKEQTTSSIGLPNIQCENLIALDSYQNQVKYYKDNKINKTVEVMEFQSDQKHSVKEQFESCLKGTIETEELSRHISQSSIHRSREEPDDSTISKTDGVDQIHLSQNVQQLQSLNFPESNQNQVKDYKDEISKTVKVLEHRPSQEVSNKEKSSRSLNESLKSTNLLSYVPQNNHQNLRNESNVNRVTRSHVIPEYQPSVDVQVMGQRTCMSALSTRKQASAVFESNRKSGKKSQQLSEVGQKICMDPNSPLQAPATIISEESKQSKEDLQDESGENDKLQYGEKTPKEQQAIKFMNDGSQAQNLDGFSSESRNQVGGKLQEVNLIEKPNDNNKPLNGSNTTWQQISRINPGLKSQESSSFILNVRKNIGEKNELHKEGEKEAQQERKTGVKPLLPARERRDSLISQPSKKEKNSLLENSQHSKFAIKHIHGITSQDELGNDKLVGTDSELTSILGPFNFTSVPKMSKISLTLAKDCQGFIFLPVKEVRRLAGPKKSKVLNLPLSDESGSSFQGQPPKMGILKSSRKISHNGRNQKDMDTQASFVSNDIKPKLSDSSGQEKYWLNLAISMKENSTQTSKALLDRGTKLNRGTQRAEAKSKLTEVDTQTSKENWSTVAWTSSGSKKKFKKVYGNLLIKKEPETAGSFAKKRLLYATPPHKVHRTPLVLTNRTSVDTEPLRWRLGACNVHQQTCTNILTRVNPFDELISEGSSRLMYAKGIHNNHGKKAGCSCKRIHGNKNETWETSVKQESKNGGMSESLGVRNKFSNPKSVTSFRDESAIKNIAKSETSPSMNTAPDFKLIKGTKRSIFQTSNHQGSSGEISKNPSNQSEAKNIQISDMERGTRIKMPEVIKRHIGEGEKYKVDSNSYFQRDCNSNEVFYLRRKTKKGEAEIEKDINNVLGPISLVEGHRVVKNSAKSVTETKRKKDKSAGPTLHTNNKSGFKQIKRVSGEACVRPSRMSEGNRTRFCKRSRDLDVEQGDGSGLEGMSKREILKDMLRKYGISKEEFEEMARNQRPYVIGKMVRKPNKNYARDHRAPKKDKSCWIM